MGPEGDLRNTNVVMENCPIPWERRKLGENLLVLMEGQEDGVNSDWRWDAPCMHGYKPLHLVWRTPPFLGDRYLSLVPSKPHAGIGQIVTHQRQG